MSLEAERAGESVNRKICHPERAEARQFTAEPKTTCHGVARSAKPEAGSESKDPLKSESAVMQPISLFGGSFDYAPLPGRFAQDDRNIAFGCADS